MRLLAVLCALVVGCSLAPTIQPGPTSSQSLQAFIPVAESFVEQHRGLKFKSHVKVGFATDAEFQKRLAATDTSDPALFKTEAKVFRALGLVDGTPDLQKAQNELTSAAVIGFYDPKAKELLVRGVDAKPSVRQVLVHELTHALQDQWFAIDRPTHNEDERDIAFSALVEGDAVRIENQYLASLSEADRRQASSGTSGGAPPADVPSVLVDLISFPYLVGPPFVDALVRSGGQSRLDAAFTSPPTSTAEVLDPARFLAKDVGALPAAPNAGGVVIDKGVIGELGLLLVLERMVARGEVAQSEVQPVASAWAGDRYVAWDAGSQTCVRAGFAMTDGAAGHSLGTLLSRFAADHPGSTVEGTGPVVLTACG